MCRGCGTLGHRRCGANRSGHVRHENASVSRRLRDPRCAVCRGVVAALLAILQYSVRPTCRAPSIRAATRSRNFLALLKPLYLRVFIDTAWICFLTAVATLLAGYPIAYALVHARRPAVKGWILITVVTPLFLGEVVRTYSWVIVLGNNGFINTMLLKAGMIEKADPVHVHHLRRGGGARARDAAGDVVMLAAALAHIDPAYERAAASLGASPLRGFLTVTLPLSAPASSLA